MVMRPESKSTYKHAYSESNVQYTTQLHRSAPSYRLLNDDEISLLNIGFGFADIRSHVNELLHNPRRSIRA